MPSFVTIPLLFVFPALMAYAACSDLLTMRITNRMVLSLTVGFLVVAVIAGLPVDQIGLHVVAAAIVLAVCFSFFALGWIGGGDAKLIAATTLWFGFGSMLQYLIYASLLGGALTLTLLVFRRWLLPYQLKTVVWIDRLHDHKTGVPYGIALAAAALLVYPTSNIFERLAG